MSEFGLRALIRFVVGLGILGFGSRSRLVSDCQGRARDCLFHPRLEISCVSPVYVDRSYYA